MADTESIHIRSDTVPDPIPQESYGHVVPRFKNEFVLKHVFKDVTNLEENKINYSEWEDHFNVNWYMSLVRQNRQFKLYVHCGPITTKDDWRIQTNLEFKVVGRNRNEVLETDSFTYRKSDPWGTNTVLEWEKMKNEYLVDGNLAVEVKITIFLASQSSYFKSLLLEISSKSKQSEIALPGIVPSDFHSFMEVLYGEYAIDDSNVEGVLLLADRLDVPTVKRRCEEFLLTWNDSQVLPPKIIETYMNFTCAIANFNSKAKQFILKHSFQNVTGFKEGVDYYSEKKDHFNVNWYMSVKHVNNYLGCYVCCVPIAPSDKWSIQTNLEFKVVGRNKNDVIKTRDFCYEKYTGWGFPQFLECEKMEQEYLMDGNLTVEVKVTIIETTGLGKKKIREFDESRKDVSDVILVVRDSKFYVSKMYLASQSSFFKSLSIGNSSFSNKPEITLPGIDSNDFNYFLEVLYGESAIDDSNVEGVLLLADRLDVPTVKRRCEEFLLKESKKTLEKKQQLASCYYLKNWNFTCAIVNDNSKCKQFELKHTFKNVKTFEKEVDYFSEWEEHFNMNWRMSVIRWNHHIGVYVYSEPIDQWDNWSIRTKLMCKVVGRNQNDVVRTQDDCYEEYTGRGIPRLLGWEKMEQEYLMDGNLTVEVKMTVIETFRLEEEQIREFGESQKYASDVILVVRGTEFHVSKKRLAAESLFFKTLFSENCLDQVPLTGVDPYDFYYFLKVLYENPYTINDSTIEGILLTADKYEAPLVVEKCQEFLLNWSKKSFKKKLELSVKYNLEELKKKMLERIQNDGRY